MCCCCSYRRHCRNTSFLLLPHLLAGWPLSPQRVVGGARHRGGLPITSLPHTPVRCCHPILPSPRGAGLRFAHVFFCCNVACCNVQVNAAMARALRCSIPTRISQPILWQLPSAQTLAWSEGIQPSLCGALIQSFKVSEWWRLDHWNPNDLDV
jgi:hypothetical protein